MAKRQDDDITPAGEPGTGDGSATREIDDVRGIAMEEDDDFDDDDEDDEDDDLEEDDSEGL